MPVSAGQWLQLVPSFASTAFRLPPVGLRGARPVCIRSSEGRVVMTRPSVLGGVTAAWHQGDFIFSPRVVAEDSNCGIWL